MNRFSKYCIRIFLALSLMVSAAAKAGVLQESPACDIRLAPRTETVNVRSVVVDSGVGGELVPQASFQLKSDVGFSQTHTLSWLSGLASAAVVKSAADLCGQRIYYY